MARVDTTEERVTSEHAPAAQRLAAFVTQCAFSELPGEVINAAKLHLLDVVGCGLAAHGVGAAEYLQDKELELGSHGTSSVIGMGESRAAPLAALANGILCHALDFDDTHEGAISHISAVVVPAALATAEIKAMSGRDLLTAVVAANEVVARIGMEAAPSYMKTGFHPTSVCGVFGAAAAAARLRGLDERKTVRAFGIAGSLASGLFEYLEDGSRTKAIHAGWAAHAGLMAAMLANAGAEGPATVLEGRFGVLTSYFRLNPPNPVGQEWKLGEQWETPAISYKRYPSCHFTHSAMDGARRMLDQGLDPHAIHDILVGVPASAVPLVLEPVDHKLRPRSPFDAKFSLQYSLASMLVHGEVDISTYQPQRIVDEQVLDVARLVRFEVENFDRYPGVLPSRVTIQTNDGATHTSFSPENGIPLPFTRNDIIRKFRANASLALPVAEVRALERNLLELESAENVQASILPIRNATPRGAG
jgi:2-methylcitrate dehydratase PrpD